MVVGIKVDVCWVGVGEELATLFILGHVFEGDAHLFSSLPYLPSNPLGSQVPIPQLTQLGEVIR